MSGMSIQKPRAELVAVADALDAVVLKYLALERGVEATLTPPVQGLAMSWIVARNVQAVALLARTNELFIPAAWANTRTAFEVGVRLIWLLRPDDAMERQMRFLAMYNEYAEYHELMAREQSPNFFSDRHEVAAKSVRSDLAKILTLVPQGYKVPKRLPDVRTALKDIRNEALYALYKEGSQFQHGSLAATAVYLRASQSFDEVVNLREWALPVRTAWTIFREVTIAVTLRLSRKRLDWRETSDRIDALILALAEADQSPQRDSLSC
jgi:hypothetical protein